MIYAGDYSPTETDKAVPDEVRDASPVAGDTPYVKPPKIKKHPVCIQTGTELEEDRLMRFVIGPENTLYPDFSAELPGKILWCSLYRRTVQDAIDSNAFARAAGQDVVIPADMMEQIERGLRHKALSLLSMTKKAGHLLTGAEKTEQVLRSGKAGIYLTAAAKDADTREKLTFLAMNTHPPARVVDLFTSEELSRASGANKVFHAVMTRGGTTDRFFIHVKRMNLFRNQD